MKLRAKILMLVILPLVLMAVVTYVLGSRNITAAMTESISNGMEATAIATRDAISVGVIGDFRVDENGELWKGESLNISQRTDLADDVKEATGMEVTVFFGDTRYMTSVTDDAGKRVIGTKASDVVIEHVLNKGETYFAQNVDVAGEAFFAFYVPFCIMIIPRHRLVWYLPV